jgi:hypothetical protein
MISVYSFLLHLGRNRYSGYARPPAHKTDVLDLMSHDGGTVWFAGIPCTGGFYRIKSLLEVDGHCAITSEHQSSPKGD